MERSTLSVTVDIEDWYHIPSVTGSPFSIYKDTNDFFEKWKGRYNYLSKPTERTLTLLDDFGIQATFFVVAEVVKHYPGLIESIIDRGHEVACHGLTHMCKIDPISKEPLISIQDFEKRTLVAKSILERLWGESVTGYRAPNALISGWMIDSLETIGFKYDSSVSVNSFYNKSDSPLSGVSTTPYYPQKNRLDRGPKRPLIEFPLAYLALLGLKIPTTGGPSLRFLWRPIFLQGIEQSLKRGHTVLYFHPIDISREKFPNIGRRRPFYWVVKGEVIEKKLISIFRHLKGVKMCCLKDVLGELQ